METIDKILQLVEESGLTAKEYAVNAGLGAGNITDWKTGRSKPSVESLQKISEFSKVSLEWLTGISYFKSRLHHIYSAGKATGFILEASKEDCYSIESIINSILKKEKSDLGTSTKYVIDYIKRYLFLINQDNPNLFTDLLIEIIQILYFDFIENKDIYKVLYGNEHFSIIAFLIYSSTVYAPDEAKNEIQKKINSLQKDSSTYKELENKQFFFMCPVYKNIPANKTNWSEECISGRLPIDYMQMKLVPPEEYFFFHIYGDQMNKIVKDGAFALIHKQDFVENGEIALVIVNNNDAILRKYTKQGNLVILEPVSRDSTYTVQAYGADVNINILGKYVGKFEINT